MNAKIPSIIYRIPTLYHFVAQIVKNLPTIGRREWLPTPLFLPGKPQGQRSLVGYSLWGPKESDTTEQLAQAHDSKILQLQAQRPEWTPVPAITLCKATLMLSAD